LAVFSVFAWNFKAKCYATYINLVILCAHNGLVSMSPYSILKSPATVTPPATQCFYKGELLFYRTRYMTEMVFIRNCSGKWKAPWIAEETGREDPAVDYVPKQKAAANQRPASSSNFVLNLPRMLAAW